MSAPTLAELRARLEVKVKQDGSTFVNGSAALVPADWGGTYLTPADLIAALRPHLPGGRS